MSCNRFGVLSASSVVMEPYVQELPSVNPLVPFSGVSNPKPGSRPAAIDCQLRHSAGPDQALSACRESGLHGYCTFGGAVTSFSLTFHT